MRFFFNPSTFSYNGFLGHRFLIGWATTTSKRTEHGMQEEEERKRAQDLMRICERKNHLNTAVNEDNSDISILEDPINAAEEEDAQEVSSLPEFQEGEIVSVQGNTRDRG